MGGMRNYAAANIGFYVLLVPGLLVWLTYGAVRNAQTLRQLNQRRA